MRSQTKFICQQCGFQSLGWLGKCPSCDTWNSLVETVVATEARKGKWGVTKNGEIKLQKLQELKAAAIKRISTGIGEFDRVLGGGLVPGSVVLLAGDPGIGKSTLLLQAAANIGSVLYVSGEESPEQIKIGAERLGVEKADILFLAETNVERIVGGLEDWKKNPVSLVIIDSIQTMYTEDLAGTPGSVGQVREAAAKLLHFAKTRGVPMFFVGHVTKEGAIAGPMVLSHLVDTVLFFEGERYQALRLLRGVKNRFGPTEELGVFSMEEKGLVEVGNPSALFLAERQEKIPGSAVTCLLEGSRPLLVEVQALVVPSPLPIPRRVASGIDWNRLALLVAVLSRRAGLPLSGFDVFVNVVGGLKIGEPAADLAISLSIASAWADKPIDPRLCLLGEVGLLGEIRTAGQMKKRIQEAKRLGFTKVITSQEIRTLNQAIRLLISK